MEKLCLTTFITILLLGCSSNQNRIRQSADPIDSLKHVIQRLAAKNDSLKKIIIENKRWFYPASDGREFLTKGINDPLAYIKQTLRRKPELIPLKPVLGGTMHFTRIKVLGEKWVIARYEDGHVMGKSLYRYELQQDTTIEFRVLLSVGPQ